MIDPAPVRPLNVRRKRTLPADTSAFAGMTATALRALTSTNTQRNQQQVVSLKTEVIRKEGKRPGSPTTKVRTIMEKQREVKAQQRQERAERRARRSSEGMHADEAQADVSVDLGDVSNVTVDEDGVPVRHRRGPGDEEDYETPPRPDRPFKRERLDHEVEAKGDKRVKWDRGLATAVYIDEITLNPKKPVSAEAVKKGCLAPTSKVSIIFVCSMGMSNKCHADFASRHAGQRARSQHPSPEPRTGGCSREEVRLRRRRR